VIEHETLGDIAATNNLSNDTARPEELYRTLGWTYLFFATSVREPSCRPSCHNCFHIATDFTFLLAKNFASALQRDEVHSIMNSPDKITVIVCSVQTRPKPSDF